jgi:hypothetical protein
MIEDFIEGADDKTIEEMLIKAMIEGLIKRREG